MAPQPHAPPGNSASKKRKDAPTNQQAPRNNVSHKRHKPDHRSKQRDARQLSAQCSSKALKNGELDVDKFIKARDYEIKALQDGMSRSKQALTKRAFQQVPKDLRRRTASHNVKKVPKRLQARAKREVRCFSFTEIPAKRRVHAREATLGKLTCSVRWSRTRLPPSRPGEGSSQGIRV
jgi:ribonuclease P/MRP protein subunit POP1